MDWRSRHHQVLANVAIALLVFGWLFSITLRTIARCDHGPHMTENIWIFCLMMVFWWSGVIMAFVCLFQEHMTPASGIIFGSGFATAASFVLALYVMPQCFTAITTIARRCVELLFVGTALAIVRHARRGE